MIEMVLLDFPDVQLLSNGCGGDLYFYIIKMHRLSISTPIVSRHLGIAMLMHISLLLSCLSPFLSSNKTGENTTVALDTNLVALYIPLQKVLITVRDETRSLHLPDINEAFLIEVANALSQYEVSRRCKVMSVAVSEDHDSASVIVEDSLLKTFGSKMPAESGSIEKISAAIRSIASQCSVDLVILPLKASVTETLSKQKGWR